MIEENELDVAGNDNNVDKFLIVQECKENIPLKYGLDQGRS